MAAATVGNKSTNTTNPGGTTITFNHTQDAGSDGLLVIAISMNKVNNTTTVKYNGVALTQRLKYNGSSNRYGFWELEAPATGSNQVEIKFTAATWNPVLTTVQSYTGAQGGGAVANNDVSASPHSRTRTSIVADSLIMMMSNSNSNLVSGSSLKVDGVSITKSVLSGSGYSMVGTSTLALSGSVVCIATASATWMTLTNQTLEILAVAAATPVISVSPSSLSGFTYAEGSGPSSAQSYTWSITDATNDVVATAPTNYELATTEFGVYGPTITAGGPPTGPYTHWIRLKAGLSEATYSGVNLTLTSTGAVTENVALSGSVTAAPITRRRIIIC